MLQSCVWTCFVLFDDPTDEDSGTRILSCARLPRNRVCACVWECRPNRVHMAGRFTARVPARASVWLVLPLTSARTGVPRRRDMPRPPGAAAVARSRAHISPQSLFRKAPSLRMPCSVCTVVAWHSAVSLHPCTHIPPTSPRPTPVPSSSEAAAGQPGPCPILHFRAPQASGSASALRPAPPLPIRRTASLGGLHRSHNAGLRLCWSAVLIRLLLRENPVRGSGAKKKFVHRKSASNFRPL